ncbi:F-box/kelch-repeat protein At3g18720 [Linum perenne]
MSPEPWLVHFGRDTADESKTFYTLSSSAAAGNIPEMRGKTIFAGSHDWLLLLNLRRRNCSLMNPATMEEIQLPNLLSDSVNGGAISSPPPSDLAGAISSPPSDLGVVLLVRYQGSNKVGFLSCKVGDEEWTEFNVGGGGGGGAARCFCQDHWPELDFLPLVHAVAGFNGEIVALTGCCRSMFKVEFEFERRSVRLIDLNLRKPEKYRADIIRNVSNPRLSLVQYSAHELMIVEMYRSEYSEERGVFDNDCSCRGIELYKVNLQDKVWESVETLHEDCAIFIGSHPSNILVCNVAADSSRLVRGNTIYFMKRTDGYLYTYDVRERSIGVSLPWPGLKMGDCSQVVWIPPLGSSSTVVCDHEMEEAEAEAEESVSDMTMVVSGDRWCDIPIHLLSSIQSRLLGADRCFFRLVCRTWEQSFSGYTVLNSRPHRFPILIWMGNGSGGRACLFDPITNSVSTLPPSPHLAGAVIRCSKHGWLLVTQGTYGRSIFFYNPFTGERIDLPNLSLYSLEGITFSSPPTSPDCTVLGYSISWPNAKLKYLRRGYHTWINHQKSIDEMGSMKSYANPVYHQGLFHFVANSANSNSNSNPCSSMRRTHMVECNGRLLVVSTGHVGKFLQVYEHNKDANTFEKLDSLGDTMLFVSSASTLSASEISGLGNKVFFDRFNGEDGVFYSLATKKFHTFWSGYNSNDWCDTKEYTNSAWIEPNFETHTKDELRWF